MNRHYQALCQHKALLPGMNDGTPQPTGGPFTVRHILGGDPAAAIKEFTRQLTGAGFHVISVTELYAEVDWSKPVYDLDEAAELTNIRGGTLSAKKANGTIPWNSTVNGVPARVYLKSIEAGLNKCGQEVLKELARQE
jgi:hypothetical protein